jgi:hypothetical protein
VKLLTKPIRAKLEANYRATGEALANGQTPPDHMPVVKLFNPCGGATWLFTELDPEDGDSAFGLCDLGFGEPELGYASIAALASTRVGMGLGIERDIHWKATKTLSQYANEARKNGEII